MTALREAAQQALEALESRCGTNAEERGPAGVITALRAALADGDKVAPTEPVAWIYEFYADMGYKRLAFEEQPSAYNTPLYVAPPQRKPLTEEEIINIGKAARAVEGSHILPVSFARAIEQAHGIK